MLSSLSRLFCCCCSGREYERNEIDERARLLQFQIPTMPSQPVQAQESSYRQRMGTIVRNMEGKMVNVTSRLPFNLHNRVIHDSIGSRSPSQSLDYVSSDYHNNNDDNDVDDDDNDSYRSLLRRHNSTQKRAYEYRYPVYYQSSRSRTPSIGQGPLTSIDHEAAADKPTTAILSLRLVGSTEMERGRARERTAKPTGLGGGIVAGSTATTTTMLEDTEVVESYIPSELKFINPVMSSWNDPISYRHPN